MNFRHAFALVLAAGAASCAPQFTIAAQYSPKSLDGDIGFNSGGGGANTRNSVDDLGLDDEADAVGLVADFKWGTPHLTVAGEHASWDGRGVLTANYGAISAGTPVDSEADIGLYRGILTFDLLPTDKFELGLGFGLSLIDIDAEVSGGGTTETLDEPLPVPVLALRGGLRVWRVDLQAILAGLSVEIDDGEASYFEADLSGRIAIFGSPGGANGSLVLGWHGIDIDAEYDDGSDDIDVDLDIEGPYFGLQIGI